jgi:hypothetical protein
MEDGAGECTGIDRKYKEIGWCQSTSVRHQESTQAAILTRKARKIIEDGRCKNFSASNSFLLLS